MCMVPGVFRATGEKKKKKYMVAEWFLTGVCICWIRFCIFMEIEKLKLYMHHLPILPIREVDDGFTTILTFEGGTEVLVEVGTNNYISCQDGMCWVKMVLRLSRDWQLNGEIIRKTGKTEEKVVPVKTAAGLTKTMAPRREDTIVKEELPKVSGDIADFHRNVAAVIRDGGRAGD